MGWEIEGRGGRAFYRRTGDPASRRHGHERRIEHRSLFQADRRHQCPVRRSNLSSDAIRARNGFFAFHISSRRSNSPPTRGSLMNEAVIVSTARTAVGKAYRCALNNTEGPPMAGHVIAETGKQAKIDPGDGEAGAMGSPMHPGTMAT